MLTETNGAFMVLSIWHTVLLKPQRGICFVPFMNTTTLFSAMNLSMASLSSGARPVPGSPGAATSEA
jgi:hypothetical protein